MEGMRIYFVGAHSTGKTTMARHTAERTGLPLITEVARGVLAELELDLSTLRTDIDTVTRYQREVLLRQIQHEGRYPGGFVSDRAFDNIAYAAHHTLATREFMRTPSFERYMESLKDGILFFIRPHPELVSPDGVRSALGWEEVVIIDGMIKFALEMYDLPYIPIASVSMQERVRLVESVLSLVKPRIEAAVLGNGGPVTSSSAAPRAPAEPAARPRRRSTRRSS